MLKALSNLKIFMFLIWLFGYVKKQLDKKANINFKIYDIPDWTINNYNTNIGQYLKKEGQSGRELGQLIEYSMENIFLQQVPDFFLLFKEALYEIKASGQHLSFNIFW